MAGRVADGGFGQNIGGGRVRMAGTNRRRNRGGALARTGGGALARRGGRANPDPWTRAGARRAAQASIARRRAARPRLPGAGQTGGSRRVGQRTQDRIRAAIQGGVANAANVARRLGIRA